MVSRQLPRLLQGSHRGHACPFYAEPGGTDVEFSHASTHFPFPVPLVSAARQETSCSSISRSGAAAAIGGGLQGRPRHSKIFLIASSGGWIAATIALENVQGENSVHKFSP